MDGGDPNMWRKDKPERPHRPRRRKGEPLMILAALMIAMSPLAIAAGVIIALMGR